MTSAQNKLTVLIQPCDSGTCPVLYADEAGRIFVQGNKLNRAEHGELSIPGHEEVVEISPELIAYLKSS